MESGRSPKWQVAAPASGSEIRDATTSRGWKGRRRNSLRVVPYKTVDPSWAGTSGLWLRIHLVQELWKCSSLFYRWKRRTVGGNLSRRVLLNKLFSLSLFLLFLCPCEWWKVDNFLFLFFYIKEWNYRTCFIFCIEIFDSLFKRICNLSFKEYIQKRSGFGIVVILLIKLCFFIPKTQKNKFSFSPFLYPFLKIIKKIPFEYFIDQLNLFQLQPTIYNVHPPSQRSIIEYKVILSGGTFSTMRLRIQYGGSILFRGQPLPVLPWKGKKRRLLVS